VNSLGHLIEVKVQILLVNENVKFDLSKYIWFFDENISKFFLLRAFFEVIPFKTSFKDLYSDFSQC